MTAQECGADDWFIWAIFITGAVAAAGMFWVNLDIPKMLTRILRRFP